MEFSHERGCVMVFGWHVSIVLSFGNEGGEIGDLGKVFRVDAM